MGSAARIAVEVLALSFLSDDTSRDLGSFEE